MNPVEVEVSSRQIAVRILNACDTCKRSRRKCNGADPCDGCARRGISCLYTKNRKRGRPRLPVSRKNVMRFLQHRPTDEHPQEPDGDAIPDVDHGQSHPGFRVSRFGGSSMPTTLVLTADERDLLRGVFDFTNRVIVAVDEAHFYTTLDALQPGMTAARAPPPTPMTAALRACCAMLLSAGSRLRGRGLHAAGYLAEARRALGSALTCKPPSQLLISALLLFALSGSGTDGEAARHAALAHSLAPFVPDLRADIRFGVAMIRTMHAGRHVAWPPLRASIGASLLPRRRAGVRRARGYLSPPRARAQASTRSRAS